MDISILGFNRSLEDIRTNIERTSHNGFTGYWLPNGRGSDALTALSVVGADIQMRFGTAVIPVHPRHPVALAQQALTANSVLGGRLILGIGVSHRSIVEDEWGLSYVRPIKYLTEYLDALLPLLEDHRASVDGERISMHGELDIDAPTCPVFVAALGPQMLRLAGQKAAGIITWMVGINTLRELTVPTVTAAAERAGRDTPEIVVGLPVCVTDDPTDARSRLVDSLRRYGDLPAYRRMIDREGLKSPGDVCVMGDEAQVASDLADYFDAGVTSIAAAPSGTEEEVDRTRAFLASLVS